MIFEDYKLPNWRIKRVPRFSSQMFSYRHIIVPAANKLWRANSVQVASVKRRLLQARRYWFRRVQELTVRELWSPSPACNAIDVQHASVRRCLYCRPSMVTYRGGKPLKPCGRSSICPFCAARSAEDLYQRVSRAIKKLRKTGKVLIATCRITTYTVAAPDFDALGWTPENVFANARELRYILKLERKKYGKIRRQLKQHTFGSLCRIVINPTDSGWEIQIRQFFITRPKSKRPANRPKKSATLFLQSAKITDFQATMELLGKVVEYPSGFLLSYVELTAAALNARNGLRLNNATGCLYKRGRVKKARPPEPPPLPCVP